MVVLTCKEPLLVCQARLRGEVSAFQLDFASSSGAPQIDHLELAMYYF